MVLKKQIKFCYVNVDNTIVSKLIKTKTNSKYLIGYSDEVRQPLVLILPKWMDMLKHLKLKMEIKIRTINWLVIRKI